MVYLTLILCILNTGLIVYFVFLRTHRQATQEEQMISRGLQLVQSKIAILEDLSDQVDHQVKQISTLLEGKYRELQTHLNDADQRLNEIQSQVQRGQEVSKLFKDKIPHEEMIQRKNLVKYVKAAKMAHAGANIEDIAKVVDIPASELEMIFKVNKDSLMFNEQALPDWVKDELQEIPQEFVEDQSGIEMESLLSRENPLVMNTKMQAAPDEKKALRNLGEQFKRATQQSTAQTARPSATMATPTAPQVRPYEFRKINGNSLE